MSMLDFRERIDDHQEGLQSVMDGRQANIWTSFPGIITAVNYTGDAITCSVQPAIQSVVLDPQGKRVNTTLPLLVDVPIIWPRGGKYTLTFPIAENDECLVVIASRCIDNWWAHGGVQPQYEQRMHDLSDGFAIVGPFSQKTKIADVSATTAQLRSNDGTHYVEVDIDNKKVNLVADDCTVVVDSNAGDITLTARQNVNITAGGTITLAAPAVNVNASSSSNWTATGALNVLSNTSITVTAPVINENP